MDEYTRGRTQRFSDQLDSMTDKMESLEYFGSAEGVVFASVNGKHELLSIEIDPRQLYPENAQRLQDLILEAIRDAHEEASIAQQYSCFFIDEDLCLGC